MSDPAISSPTLPVRPSLFSPRDAIILGASAVFSLYIGFLCFDSARCEWLVRHLGYAWMLVVTIGLLAAVIFACREEQLSWRTVWPGRGHATLIILAWLFLLRMDPPGYKTFFDEPVQASTAFTLHQERELATTVRGYQVNGLYRVLKVYLDKRPPFFPFLVATMHDLTGYRVSNALVVNALGTLALVGLVWQLGRRVGGCAAAGGWAVALMATLPILGVTATGAGMDLINVTLIAAFGCAALWYVERPLGGRAAVFVLTTVAVAFTRYESALYTGCAALVWAAVCWRERRWLHARIWALLPLALVFYGWHHTVLANSPSLWELRDDQTHRFSLDYTANNLRHAAKFLFNTSRTLPNSVFLTVTGLAGGGLLMVQLLRRRSALPPAARLALAATGAGILANLALLMCYYWGELDDPIVTRLSLPLHLLLVALAVAGWAEWRAVAPRWGTWRIPALGTAAAVLIWTIPAVAQHRYTATNLMRKNLEWEQRAVAKLWPAPDLMITSRSPICWLADRVPAIGFDRARGREDALRWHLEHHSFSTVLVMQRVLTLGREGGWGVDVTDRLPDHWRLQEVAVRRIGLTLTRISRLVAIESAPPVSSSPSQ